MPNRRSVLSFASMLIILVSSASAQQGVAGTWKGTLPKANLPLVFQFGADGNGTVESTAQNYRTAASITVNGTNVVISVPDVKGTFTGTLQGTKMTGTWTQGSGYSDDLVLLKQ